MTVKIYGNEFEALRVNNDVNGNPRYVIHFLNFITPEDELIINNKPYRVSALYNRAIDKARKIGGRMYRAKSYGGGIVFTSYNLQADLDQLE